MNEITKEKSDIEMSLLFANKTEVYIFYLHLGWYSFTEVIRGIKKAK